MYFPPLIVLSPARQFVFAVWRGKRERGDAGVWQPFPTGLLRPRLLAGHRGGKESPLTVPAHTGLRVWYPRKDTARRACQESRIGSDTNLLWDLKVPLDPGSTTETQGLEVQQF